MMGEQRNNFFRLPGLLWLILIPLGLLLLTMVMLCPYYVPYSYLGPVGTFAKLLVVKYPTVLTGLFYSTILLHALEAYYAVRTARQKNLQEDQVWKWGVSTAIYGIFNLKYLLSYEPPAVKEKTM